MKSQERVDEAMAGKFGGKTWRGAVRTLQAACLVVSAALTTGSMVSTNVFYGDPVFPVADGAYRRCLWDNEAGDVFRGSFVSEPICETVTFKRGPGGYEVVRVVGPDDSFVVNAAYRDEWRFFPASGQAGEKRYVVFSKYEGEPAYWTINLASARAPNGYDLIMSDDRCNRMNADARGRLEQQGDITRIDRSRGRNLDRCYVRESREIVPKVLGAPEDWSGMHRYSWVFYARR